MGALHSGHVALLEEGRRRAARLALSIFVNPTQFGVNEDLDSYPRDLERDTRVAQGAGVDISSQLLAMLPYIATIVVLAIISRNPLWIRINMPASLGQPFHPG